MKLSIKVDYACRVLAQLARRHDGDRLTHIHELAKAEAVPPNYLVQILCELRNGGLISSRRGKQGGYKLARPPNRITLLDVVQVIEGELLEITPSAAGQSAQAVYQVWSKLRDTFEGDCATYNLTDCAANVNEEMYYI